MNRTMKCGGQSDVTSPAEVPIGWQRRIHQSRVVYISPSGSVLACLEEAKTYLLSDGTCKCGLECPLIPHKVFNFDAGAAVKQRTAEDAKTDSDVTKLCIHKRKIIAVATLHRSMGSKLLTAPTGADNMSSSNNHQAKRNDVFNGSTNNVSLDGKKSYKMPISGHLHYRHELGSPPYTSNARSRLCGGGGGGGGGDHNAQKSPYRSHHSSFLTPLSSTSCSLLHHDDGNPSHRSDPLSSPDPSILHFHRTLSPSSAHKNGEGFAPLSPHHVVVHSSPSSTKLSCAMGVMTNVPLSPSLNTKSPNRQKSPCSLPPNVNYQCNALSACYTQPLPPCVIQKKPVPSSEKDPLGILDPIPSKNPTQDQIVSSQSNIQFYSHPQVSCMSTNVPPSIVPLPSNLPLPVVKPAPAGHGLRFQYPTPSSVSSSPITSPVHVAGPAPVRFEETFYHSQSSVSSSTQRGSCPLSMGVQMSKLPSRAPRASVATPRTSLPLQHLKEAANQLEGGRSRQPYSLCPPAPGFDSVSQSSPSLRGASQQLLDQQNPSSFPASSLLSAAAKAQLDNHNQVTVVTSTAEAQAGAAGQAGLVGGGRQMYSDGYGVSDPKYLPSSGLNLNDNQSGKAALKDKLMAQRRDAVLKHKTPRKAGGDSPFSVNVQHRSGSSSYLESMKRLLHQDTLPINTSVGRPLRSNSHQSSQNGLSHVGRHPAKSGNPPFFDECAPQISALQNVHGPHQLRDRMEIFNRQGLGKRSDNTSEPLNMDMFAGPLNQIPDPAFGGNVRTLGYSMHKATGSVCNSNPPQQMFGHHVKQSQGNPPFRDRTGLPSVMSNGGFDTSSESGEACFLNSDLRQALEPSQQRWQLAPSEKTLQAWNFILTQDSQSGHHSHRGVSSSDPMKHPIQNFQVSFPKRILHAPRIAISRLNGTTQPGVPIPLDSQQEFSSNTGDVSDPNQQIQAGLSKETMSNVPKPNTGNVFAVPVRAVQGRPSQSVIHCALCSYPEEVVGNQPRTGHTRRKPEQMNSVPMPVVRAPTGVHSPQCCPPRRQWLRDFEVPEHSLYHRDGPPLMPVQNLDGKSGYIEVSRGDMFMAPQMYAPSQVNGTDLRKGLLAYMKGGSLNPRGLYPSSNQSLEDFAASQVSEVDFHSDYGNDNGYQNGLLNGDPTGLLHFKGSINGSLMPDTVNGKWSKKVPDFADTPSSNQWFQDQSRTRHARELLLGSDLGFDSGPSKVKMEGQTYLSSVCQSTQGKVQPKRFHRTLKNDLEVLHTASKIHQSSMELKGYLEVAIEDPVSELNKLTGNRHRQVKAQKLKRRNIPR